MPPRSRPIAERFAERIVRRGDCLLWTGPTNGKGYGIIGAGGRGGGNVYVHRLAYELAVGPIPDGLHVCHTCDTPNCVEPSHLFVGTRSDNMRDASAKDRSWRLPEAARRAIAAAYHAGEASQDALALAHGVSQSSVSNWTRLYAP